MQFFLVACFVIVGMMGEPEWIQSSRKIAYIRARPCNTDDPEDIQSLRKRAEEGCAEAQYNLAERHWWDADIPRDDAKARELFTHAAKQGHVEAQFRLGTMINLGEGGLPDTKKAYVWFSVAAKGGHPHALQLRDSTAKKLDENRLRSAEFDAEFCFKEIQRKREEKSKEKTRCSCGR